ncbi:MAG: hypothetical protein ACXADU_15065 [Promethearchaeota archaeon]|jgi:hypothetical protein
MSFITKDYLKYFGEIKFAEENSMCINDFELSLKRYLSPRQKKPRERYNFSGVDKIYIGEIDNVCLKDFKRAFKNYFK